MIQLYTVIKLTGSPKASGDYSFNECLAGLFVVYRATETHLHNFDNYMEKYKVKKTVKLTFSILMASIFVMSTQISQSAQLSGTLSLSESWAIYPLAVKWKKAFQQTYRDGRDI